MIHKTEEQLWGVLVTTVGTGPNNEKTVATQHIGPYESSEDAWATANALNNPLYDGSVRLKNSRVNRVAEVIPMNAAAARHQAYENENG